ncbi:chromosome partitioning protein ParA [Tabrizicola piscis]|uniref:non-specific protein-tyrosine kinase n=1 Tax=Tabrizicola piscis TaxID=2494374 RepID=A0A3S8U3N2_9RHOB|nr:AAA family ATPase [Tabrizicola piscis]AZL58139.1 chromosome partitioning protein ParA [Tabrizicola piscis]
MTQIGLRLADSPNTLSPRAAEERADTIDLSRLLAIVRRRRRAILVPVALSLALGVAYLATTPKSYLASSTLLLDAGTSAVVRELVAMDSSRLSDVAIENARLVIRSDILAAAVAQKLDLATNDSFLNPPRSLASRLVRGAVGVVRLPVDVARMVFQPAPSPATAPGAEVGQVPPQIIRDLSGKIGVERISRSGGVSVYFRSHDPALAAAIVNAYSEAYIADVLSANFESTERTTEWLQGRLSDLEAAAADAAAAAEAFRAENGLMSSDGRFMSEESVSELNADLGEAIADAARSKALVESYEAVVSRGVEGLQSGAQVGTGTTVDPALEELQSNLSNAVADLNRITASFGADHPQAELMTGAVATAAERLFTGVQQRLERARGEYAVSQARVEALRDSLGVAMGDNAAGGAARVELRALEQRAETLSTLYQTFLTQFQEIDQQKDFPIADVRILSLAEVPRDADGPRASRVLAVMLVMGLFFGTLLAAVREWRDRFLRTGEDVATASGLPFLGYLPDMTLTTPATTSLQRVWQAARRLLNRSDHDAPDEPPLEVQNHAIYTETLQNIRLGLSILHASGRERPLGMRRVREVPPGGEHLVVGITSVRPGEGKSTLALDLASTLAASGKPVLLIDADMRRSGLSRGLGITSGPSLVEVALGQVPWTEALRKHDLAGVDVLPCVFPGGIVHVAELLTSKPVQDMLRDARQTYAHVIVDLAPLGPVVDARLLLRALDHVVMVAEWGTTPKALLRRVVEAEQTLAERLVGVVLNRVDMVALRDYVDRSSLEAYLGTYGEYQS